MGLRVFDLQFVAFLATAILSLISILYFYILILYPTIFTPLRDIPTPPGRSLLTGATLRLPGGPHTHDPRYWRETIPNDGLIRFYLVGGRERLLVTSAKALSEILVTKASHFVKPEFVRRRLYYVTGNGLLLAEGEEHSVQRKSFMPVFSFRHVKDLYPIFWSKARELTEVLADQIAINNSKKTKRVIEMRQWTSRATLDIVGLAGMDHDFGSLKDPHSQIIQQYKKMQQSPSLFETLFGVLLSPFAAVKDASVVLRVPTRRMKEIKEASRFIRNVCRAIIREKQDKADQSSSQIGIDLISVALKSDTFSNDALVDQMMTFLAAGHGTTSVALQWSVYALCKHQDVQQRLRQEICEQLPLVTDDNVGISASDIDRLAYLRAFCNEVLRFWPPVPSTIRESLHDTTVAGHYIPKGTIFSISPAVTNHDAELWGPDANVFDPERWMREGCANSGGVKNSHGFLTFIHGPRSCIGDKFARAELACLVAAIVGRFHFELEDQDKVEMFTKGGISAAPADGIRVYIEVVDGWQA
ncbi:cytochrome P450 monooxygenase [Talaromyces proteolyticus]|uniref:Cytochrome P450 monooxygenase n=1 Tax=Talaromyces proteolyticus TaxID=1131652 RepID=A0AAD4PRE6_9EURO|nr:cytochrome P450 monooxygenase [Talaromyces proteolyticus]KAH8688726.1 cytochrome P450 monooxygenase [Talaromyces proteolyticus]